LNQGLNNLKPFLTQAHQNNQLRIIMIKLFLFPVLFLIAFLTEAQEVVSTAGETQTISGYEISWTLGEPVIATVKSGSTILTQGFHQSKLTITPINEFPVSDIELKVYPNPTDEFVTINMNKLDENLSFSLFDLAGKLIESKPIITLETKLFLNACSSGTYVLKLQNGTQQTLQTFKIIKD